MTLRENACFAGASASAADALADKASDMAQKLTEQGGSLPDAAASTSQIAPAADSLADKASQGAQKLAQQGSGLPDVAASTSQAAPGAVEAAGQYFTCLKPFYKVSALLSWTLKATQTAGDILACNTSEGNTLICVTPSSNQPFRLR